MQSEDLKPVNHSRAWMKWLLVGSLALNLLVLGVLGGAWLSDKGGKPHHKGPALASAAGPLTRALSKEDRRKLGREIWRSSRTAGQDRKAHRAVLEALLTDLRATPYDADRVGRRLDEVMVIVRTRLTVTSDILNAHLAAMEAQERAAYANRLEEALQRRKGKAKN